MSELAPLATAGATPVVPVDSVVVPVPDTTPATPAAPETPATETKTEDAGQPEAAPETPDEKSDPKKNSAQERINRITADKHAAQREAQSAKQEAADLRKQLAQYQQQARELDPQDAVGQQALNTRFAVKAERLEQIEARATQADGQAAGARQAQFETKIEAARERMPDLDTVLSTFSTLPVSEVAADLIADSEKAAEITYYLGKNPQEAHRIARLAPHQQGAEIARIEAKVAPAPARKASAAPPPVKTNIGGGSTPQSKTQDDWSGDDWSKWAKGLGKRR